MFRFFGSVLGWLLWWFIEFTHNYVVAIFFFVLVVNFVMVPFTIKRLKIAPQQAKFAKKQRELRKFCGRDTKKYNEEFIKLCETEGFNPAKGTLSMFVPLLLLICVFFAVSKPLEYILHLPAESLNSMIEVAKANDEGNDDILQKNERYTELALLRNFDKIKPKLTNFEKSEISKIDELKQAFCVFNLNLIGVPKFSEKSTFLWIIPLLAFLSSVASGFVMQKVSVGQTHLSFFISYILNPLFFAWTTYVSPAAVGVYWIINSLLGAIQNFVLAKIYNKFSLGAKEEFERFSAIDREEKVYLREG